VNNNIFKRFRSSACGTILIGLLLLLLLTYQNKQQLRLRTKQCHSRIENRWRRR